MGQVVNIPPRRPVAGSSGRGGDALAARVFEEQLRQQRRAEKNAALQQSLDLFTQSLSGGKIKDPVSKEERSQAALLSSELGGGQRGPTKNAAAVMDAIPRELSRDITGSDIAKPLLDAGVDQRFAFALAQSAEESRLKREADSRENAAIEEALTGATKQGANRQDVISSITTSDLNIDRKIQLLNNLDRLVPKKDDEEDFTIKLFTPDGESIKVPVPEDVAKSQASRDEFVKKNFPGLSATPVAKQTEQGLTEGIMKRLIAAGVDPEVIDKSKAGMIRVVGPDQEGEITVIDLTNNSFRRIGGDRLTPATLRDLEQRIISITDAITLLDRTDTDSVGLSKIFAAEVGGIAIQVPVVGAIASALGFSEGDIAKIQADRGEFFTVIGPLLQSFAQDGDRRSLASKTELGIAERMLNMTRLSSTPGGASLQKFELKQILTEIRGRLMAQRLTRSVIPPRIVNPTYSISPDNKIVVD